MKANNFKVAGWVATAAVVAFVAEIILTFMSQVPAYSEVASPRLVSLALAIHIALASYAMHRLRGFLNERFEFHRADVLIPLLVGGGIALGLAVISSRFYFEPAISAILMIMIGVPLGVVSVLFGYRLLAVNGAISGYKKPFAYIHMLAPICFLSVIFAPLGLLLLLAGQILLALMFFTDESPELEFV